MNLVRERLRRELPRVSACFQTGGLVGVSDRIGVSHPASTATRLCSKAQCWTEGTTLGGGDGATLNPVVVVAHCRAMTQVWLRANPGLRCTTPLGNGA